MGSSLNCDLDFGLAGGWVVVRMNFAHACIMACCTCNRMLVYCACMLTCVSCRHAMLARWHIVHASEELLLTFRISPAIWLHFMHEIVVTISLSPQHSWWGLVLAEMHPAQWMTLLLGLFFFREMWSCIIHACWHGLFNGCYGHIRNDVYVEFDTDHPS